MTDQPADGPDADADEPGRARDAELVEEARIAAAGGGVRRIPSIFQSLCYLALVAALALVIWWVLGR
jgi:hypothetical protein